jgi:molybdenum cofactor cytidylyltransferase
MVSAILLAAGESKRMGKPKLLLPIGGSTVLEKAIDNLLNSGVDEVIVVVGDRAQEMIERIGNRPVKVTINPAYGEGMSTSIVTGLNLVNDSARAVMLALADQPLIDSQTINKLIEAFIGHDKGIVIPAYEGRRGHPVIFSTKYKKELLGLGGDIGGRQIIKEHPDDVLELAVDSEGIDIDIDTVDDYYSQVD